MRSLRYAYIGRKLRKRDFRSLWIARINAATRINGMSDPKFILRPEEGWRGSQPQGAGRSGCERCGCVRQARRGCQERVSDCAFRRIGFVRFSFSFNLRRTKRGGMKHGADWPMGVRAAGRSAADSGVLGTGATDCMPGCKGIRRLEKRLTLSERGYPAGVSLTLILAAGVWVRCYRFTDFCRLA